MYRPPGSCGFFSLTKKRIISRIDIKIIPSGGGQHEYKLTVLLFCEIVDTCVVYFGLIEGVGGIFSDIIEGVVAIRI